MTRDDSTTARIITLALSRPTFTVNEALAQVRWGAGRRSEMLVLLEHLANANSDVLEPVAGDRYAATPRSVACDQGALPRQQRETDPERSGARTGSTGGNPRGIQTQSG